MSHACVHSYRESNSLYDTSHRWWNPRNKQLNCSSFIIHVILQPCNNNNNNGAPRGRHTKPSLNTKLVRKKSHKETRELPCAANFTHIAYLSFWTSDSERLQKKVEHKTKSSSTQKMAPTQNPETKTPQKETVSCHRLRLTTWLQQTQPWWNSWCTL